MLVGLLLVGAGLLAGVVGVHRWKPCFPATYELELCGFRQGGEQDLGRFNVLPEDLRQLAVGLAVVHLVAGLLWLALLLARRQPLWRRVLATLGGVLPTLAAIADLAWFSRGELPLGRLDEGLVLLGMALSLLAASLVLPRGGGRVWLLVLGLLAGSPLQVFVDYPFWSAFSSPWDVPPGYGLAQAALMLLAGAGILGYPVLRPRLWPRIRDFLNGG